MKYGVLGFSYSGFDHFAKSVVDSGFYTSNLGDNAQTVASRNAWRSIGVSDDDMIKIDRDTLSTYDGPQAYLLMNGVFTHKNLPTPASITPIFLGFNADPNTIAQHADWLRTFAPIGCRDHNTARICQQNGIYAFVTGCVTMTFPPRATTPENGRLFIVTGWADFMPLSILRHLPEHMFENAEFIHHRHVEGRFPLPAQDQDLNENYERHLIQRYANEASLVITPLLHVATPCLAMQVPVIVCRTNYDARFDYLEKFIPIHLPEKFTEVNWSPPTIDMSLHATNYIHCLRSHANRASV